MNYIIYNYPASKLFLDKTKKLDLKTLFLY